MDDTGEDPLVWHEIGVVSCREGRLGPAEDAFRTALEYAETTGSMVGDYGTSLTSARSMMSADRWRADGAVLWRLWPRSTSSNSERSREMTGMILYPPALSSSQCAALTLSVVISLGSTSNNGMVLRRFKEAEELYSRAVVLKPRAAECHAGLAFTLHSQGNYEGAIDCYHQVGLELAFNWPEADFELALNWLLIGLKLAWSWL